MVWQTTKLYRYWKAISRPRQRQARTMVWKKKGRGMTEKKTNKKWRTRHNTLQTAASTTSRCHSHRPRPIQRTRSLWEKYTRYDLEVCYRTASAYHVVRGTERRKQNEGKGQTPNDHPRNTYDHLPPNLSTPQVPQRGKT